ncbi:MAG: aminoacyl-tRNA hydrolase [Rhodothermaceae bacterium]|nr:aminoacyl-tRNA hydrolase [Rhodothermaceae bacterium]
MASSKRLIVGLGNPGAEYEQTRHNVGFMAVDVLAEKAKITLSPDRGPALAGSGRYRGRPLSLVKPLTYMNRSGSAVRHHMKKLGLSSRDVLVLYDDLNLEPGVIRIRQKGSSGGHNGMQDIIDVLGSDDIPRVRIGIGSNFSRGRQVDYVLSAFQDDEMEVMEPAIKNAGEASLLFIREGIVAAMNRFNKKK